MPLLLHHLFTFLPPSFVFGAIALASLGILCLMVWKVRPDMYIEAQRSRKPDIEHEP